MASEIHDDEVMDIGAYAAELEMLVNGANQGATRLDPRAALDMQKLLLSIAQSDPAVVKQHQRHVEDCLTNLMLSGAPPPVRRVCCACLVQLYTVGDALPLYSRVSSLQGFLTSKESLAGKNSELSRAAALECLAALSITFGSQLGSSIPESVNIAAKHCYRGEPGIKVAALNLIAAAVEGLGDNDRNVLAVHAEALKTADRYAKDKTCESTTRCAAAGVYRAVGKVGGAGLWAYVGYAFEETVKTCIAALEHPDRAVHDAYAVALGEIAASGASHAAEDALKALMAKKPGKVPVLDKMLRDTMNTCLVAPLVAAEAAGRTAAAAALAQAWLAYLAALQARQSSVDETKLVEQALKLLTMLGTIQPAKAAAGGEADLGAGIAGGELPHAQACVLYVLRTGVVEQLSETGQRLLLERVAGVMAAAEASVPSVAAALAVVGELLEVLEEVDPEARLLVYEPTVLQLASPCLALRSQAAAVLGALAVAEPSSAASMLKDMTFKLSAATQRLAAAKSSASSDPAAADRGAIPEALRRSMNNVNGYALGLAALLGASTRLPLGVPAQLVMSAMDLAARLVGSPQSRGAAGQAAEREAGYVLLGALVLSLPPASVAAQRAELLELWRVALAPASAADLDIRKYLQAGGEEEVALEMWWRAAALDALQAYIAGPLATADSEEQTRLQRTLVQLLAPTLDAISAHAALQDPSKSRSSASGAFSAAAAVIQLRLLEAYLALPSCAAYSNQHEALTKLCSRSLRTSAFTTGSAAATANAALLRGLEAQDAVLGPLLPGRDPLEDALTAFAGAPGGPIMHAWEAGLPPRSGPGLQPGGVRSSGAGTFPQPRSLSGALLETQLLLLGPIMAAISEANQLQILLVMKSAVAEAAADSPVIVNVCCAALAGLSALAIKHRNVDSNKVAQAAAELGNLVLGQSDGSPALQRSAAEILAAAAAVGDSTFAQALLRRVVEAMAGTASPIRRSALALAAGAIHRAKGGMAMRAAVGFTVDTMLAVAASASNASLHKWLAHSLLLIANAAGLSYVPYVQATLDYALQLLMTEADYALFGMRPAVGRLANGMIAALGPELRKGSPPYNQCRAIIREMQHLEGLARGVQPAQELVAAEMETVLYAQMLALFAPQTVKGASHVTPLLATLSSRQPALRRAAADTLRHLAERDPEADSWQHVEAPLFRALDAENVSAIAAQIRATLCTLLQASAAKQPSRWLAACSAIVLASGPAASSTAEQGDEARGDQDEEGWDEEGGAAPATAAPPPPPAGASMRKSDSLRTGRDASLRMAAMSTPRLRTRLFAAQCILELPHDVGTDPRHFELDVSETPRTQSGDWLVQKLQGLVEVGFKMATGTAEALRPMGLALQSALIAKFAKAADPLQPGARLLEQYQAQLVSSLRTALQSGAAPNLAAAGAALAAAFLRQGLAGSDTVVLGRLMALLCAPLKTLQAGSPPEEFRFSETVAVRARIALLQAHAHCAVFAHLCSEPKCQQVVAKAHQPLQRQLLELWASLLVDAAVSASGPGISVAHMPKLFQSGSPGVLEGLAAPLQQAWPPVLDALTVAISDKPELLGGSSALASFRPLLLPICQMAVARASSAFGPSADGQPGGGAGEEEADEHWGEAALVLSLTAVRRVTAALAHTTGLQDALTLLHINLNQVVQPLLSSSKSTSGQRRAAAEGLAQIAGTLQALTATSDTSASAQSLLAAEIAAVLALSADHMGRSDHFGTDLAQPDKPAAQPGETTAQPLDQELQRHLDSAAAQCLAAAATLLKSQHSMTAAVQSEVKPAHSGELPAADPRTEAQSTVLAAAFRMLQAPSASPAQLASVQEFVSIAAAALGSGGDSQTLQAAGAGTLLAAAEALSGQALSATNGAAPQAPQLQAVLAALLRWGGSLPAPQAAPAPQSTSGAAATAQQVSPPASSAESKPTSTRAAADTVAAAAEGETAAAVSAEPADDDAEVRNDACSAAATTAAADSQQQDTTDEGKPTETADSTLAEPEGDKSSEDAVDSEAAASQPEGALPTEGAAVAAADSDDEFGDFDGSTPADLPAPSAEAAPGQVGAAPAQATTEPISPSEQAAAAARAKILKVLAGTQESDSGSRARLQGLLALRAFLVAPPPPGPPAAQWNAAVLAAVVPPAAAYMHKLLQPGPNLSSEDVQVVAETLKAVLAGVTAAQQRGEGGAATVAALMRVLLPLLVQTAAPIEEERGVPARALPDLAVRLITGLAAGDTSAAFRAAVAQLALPDKQKLQIALRASAMQRPGPAAVPQALNRKPAIALKMKF